MTPESYFAAIYPDAIPVNQMPDAFRRACAEFEESRASFPNDPEEISFRLMHAFFPRRAISRRGWAIAYEVAMTPNPMGVTGVMLGNPCGTDCIRLAKALSECASV